jgi:NADH-quinone oxidoreductase subunit I
MLRESWEMLVSLVKGLGITLRQLFVRPFTVQYPEERVVWPERSRGRLVLPRDPQTGAHRCTSCLMCEKICPNGSLEITQHMGESNKRVLDDFLYHLERCTFCGLCVETCPFNALRMSHEHEIAVRDRAALLRHLQNETLTFDPAWRGGLPAKADAPPLAAPPAETS